MGQTGYIDWHKLTAGRDWAEVKDTRHTYVYAFWPVDYGRSDVDHGVTLLKNEDLHPDWFVHAEEADSVLAAYCRPQTIVSPSFADVFDVNLAARPLLAAALLGTSSTRYVSADGRRAWWCTSDDLTRRGKKLLKDLNQLYLRTPVVVTFVDGPTDGNTGPRDPST